MESIDEICVVLQESDPHVKHRERNDSVLGMDHSTRNTFDELELPERRGV